MIDIPLNKALVAVANPDSLCDGLECVLKKIGRGPNRGYCQNAGHLACGKADRKDRKNVIFKLVDYQHGESIISNRDKRVIEWFISGDSGVSSETLCACLYGILPKKENKRHPGDPSDFGRCKRFLDLLSPEDKETVFREAIKLSPEWKALIENWDRLEKMYNEHDRNMFQQMQKVMNEAR